MTRPGIGQQRPARRSAAAPGLAAVRAFARAFVRGEVGATMAEYALLIAVIALVAVGATRTLGVTMRNGAIYAATFFR